jgi:hypothetical protein
MHLLASLKEHVQRGTVMVLPGERNNARPVLIKLARVIGAPAHIVNLVVSVVLLAEEAYYLH